MDNKDQSKTGMLQRLFPVTTSTGSAGQMAGARERNLNGDNMVTESNMVTEPTGTELLVKVLKVAKLSHFVEGLTSIGGA